MNNQERLVDKGGERATVTQIKDFGRYNPDTQMFNVPTSDSVTMRHKIPWEEITGGKNRLMVAFHNLQNCVNKEFQICYFDKHENKKKKCTLRAEINEAVNLGKNLNLIAEFWKIVKKYHIIRSVEKSYKAEGIVDIAYYLSPEFYEHYHIPLTAVIAFREPIKKNQFHVFTDKQIEFFEEKVLKYLGAADTNEESPWRKTQ